MHRVLPSLVALALFAVACSSDNASLVATDAPSPAATDPTPSPEPPTTPAPEGTAPTPSSDDADADDQAVRAQADAAENTTQPSPTEMPESNSPSSADEQPTTPPESVPPRVATGCAAPFAGEPIDTLTAQADIDGDSLSDVVTTYSVETTSGELQWRLRAETAAGATLDNVLSVDVGFNGLPVPLGGADVDGDGATDELFTVVGAGASTTIVAIHTVDGCDLVQAHQSGYPVTFAVGGTVGNLAGLQCIDTDANGVNNMIVAWTGEADFEVNGNWNLFGTDYVMRGSELTEAGTRALDANVREADFVYGQLTCGSVIL